MSLQEDVQRLKKGDIFHATYTGHGDLPGSAICLVVDADQQTITARTVTTHWRLVFDRLTLTARIQGTSSQCVINSAMELPAEIFDLVLELDWKFDPENPIRDPKLTEGQIKALRFLKAHYDSE
jgi:hypothetical protein